MAAWVGISQTFLSFGGTMVLLVLGLCTVFGQYTGSWHKGLWHLQGLG